MIFTIAIIITIISLTICGAVFGVISIFSDYGSFNYLLSVFVFILTETLLLLATFERRFWLFGRTFWRGPKDHNAISITFDDGPNEPYTSQILDILKEFNVKATFFVIGQNASLFPETLKREIEEGHEIGNHTYNHEVIPLKSPDYIRNQIKKTSDLIANTTGIHTGLFRTPHGWKNPYVKSVARQEKLTTVAWTLGVWDTDRPGIDLIIKRTLKGIKKGCILLLHDGKGTEYKADSSQLVEALPIIIREVKNKGYRFLTVSEMMRGK